MKGWGLRVCHFSYTGESMHLRFSVVAAAVILGASSAAAQTDNAERVIRSAFDSSAVAWNRGDLMGHLADNSDTIRFMTRSGPIVGKTGTAASLEKSFFRDGKPMQQLRFEQINVRMLGREHAMVIGRFILSGGERPEASGWFTTIWAKEKGGWKIVHDHSS